MPRSEWRFTLLLILILVWSLVAACGQPAGGQPVAAPSSPGGRAAERDQPRLVLRIEPVDWSGYSVRLVAEIVGGPDNNSELYCTSTSWSFGDGVGHTVSPMCTPWTPDVQVPRRFEQTYSYGAPGTYEVTFSRGRLQARAEISVPLDYRSKQPFSEPS